MEEIKKKQKNAGMKFVTDGLKKEIIECVICKEGYVQKPDDILGIYIWTRPITILDKDNWIN